MVTFDYAEVREFAADLNARLNQCDNSEGMECNNLDGALRHYATLCCEFQEGIRQWGRAVFAGRVAFDPKVEKIWVEEGIRLYSRAIEMLAYGEQAEVPCYVLDGKNALRSALLGLHQLFNKWVTPKLAVGPSARNGTSVTSPIAEEIAKRLSELPPLPADWKPADPRQQWQFKRLRNPGNS
jgi:hypothetical protein